MAKKFLGFILFLGAVFILFFFRMKHIPLWSSDEGRYGEIAREMWETKNFVIPHFNYLAYLEKPVLAPFLSSLSFGIFGINALVTRLVPVFSAILGILATYFFTCQIGSRRQAVYSSLVLTTTLGYVLVGRFAVIDMLMTLWLSLSLFCLMTASINQQPRCYLAAYGFMGLAFLTKGLIGILLPGLIFLAFLVWTKDLKEIARMKLGWGLLIFSLIVGPWFIAVSLKEPEFFDVFIVEQHFHRFATGGFSRHKPFWFFVPILIATSFPWSFFLPAAVGHSLNKEKRFKLAAQFLVCWIGMIFLFFSIPKSKLPYYLLPTSIPLAILLGGFLTDWIDGKEITKRVHLLMVWSWKVLMAVSSLGALGLQLYLLFGRLDEQTLTLKPLLQIGVGLLLFGTAIGFYLNQKEQRKMAAFSLAGMMYVGLMVAVIGMEAISPFQSSYAYAQLINPYLREDDMVAVYASPDEFSDFPFYLKRRVVVVGTDKGTLTREFLEKDHEHEAHDWFIGKHEFAVLFNQKTSRIFCLMESRKLEEIRNNEGLKDYYTIKEGGEKILISNFDVLNQSA